MDTLKNEKSPFLPLKLTATLWLKLVVTKLLEKVGTYPALAKVEIDRIQHF